MKLPYETVFSRVRGRIDDPKELSLDKNDLLEIYRERLHNVLGNARIRRLFSSIELDDQIEMITFELNNSVDEASDEDFVANLFILGMTIEWLEPKVNSLKATIFMIGGKEEKMMLNLYKHNVDKLESMKLELSKMVGNYGYMYNSYIKQEQ